MFYFNDEGDFFNFYLLIKEDNMRKLKKTRKQIKLNMAKLYAGEGCNCYC